VIRLKHQFVALACVVMLFGCSSSKSSDSAGAGPTTTKPRPPAADVAAIEELVQYLNASSAASADQGLAVIAASSYAVWSGSVAPDQCIAFLKSRLGYIQTAQFSVALQKQSLVPTSDRAVDPSAGKPEGRLYAAPLNIDIASRNGGVRAHVDVPTDFVIVRDGSARRLLPCA
jgi:hypothetical protein